MANFSLFQGLVGIFRIFTLLFGLIVLALTAYFFDYGRCFEGDGYHSGGDLWRVLLAIIIITFIVSLTWVVLFILGVIVDSGITKSTDMIWHIIGGVLLIIGGIIWLIAEFITKRGDSEYRNKVTCSDLQVTFVIIAGIFGIIDGVVYLTVAFFVWKS